MCPRFKISYPPYAASETPNKRFGCCSDSGGVPDVTEILTNSRGNLYCRFSISKSDIKNIHGRIFHATQNSRAHRTNDPSVFSRFRENSYFAPCCRGAGLWRGFGSGIVPSWVPPKSGYTLSNLARAGSSGISPMSCGASIRTTKKKLYHHPQRAEGFDASPSANTRTDKGSHEGSVGLSSGCDQTIILTSHDGVDESMKRIKRKKENAAYGRFFL